MSWREREGAVGSGDGAVERRKQGPSGPPRRRRRKGKCKGRGRPCLERLQPFPRGQATRVGTPAQAGEDRNSVHFQGLAARIESFPLAGPTTQPRPEPGGSPNLGGGALRPAECIDLDTGGWPAIFPHPGTRAARVLTDPPIGNLAQPCAFRADEESMAKLKFRHLHDRVVVRRVDAETKSASGIIIPDTAAEKPQEGNDIAVRPGWRN